ncbi:hypothetical protein [Cupriavidus sp. SK-3]|uniref:hypothetical protein n=1 Tax=Cupriavidus sp. SK-3 TaxID=1470558 RepID=UPI001363D98B|nr:hypothetical protein [Cupriavidus sp. SK-3]
MGKGVERELTVRMARPVGGIAPRAFVHIAHVAAGHVTRLGRPLRSRNGLVLGCGGVSEEEVGPAVAKLALAIESVSSA